MTNEEKLDDLIEIQCSHGNWNYSPYMHGMANGMILTKAILTDTDPVYLDAPKEWLCNKEPSGDLLGK
jgi:hypothetical protein